MSVKLIYDVILKEMRMRDTDSVSLSDLSWAKSGDNISNTNIGDVGIGLTPTEKFEVAGRIKGTDLTITGQITVQGGTPGVDKVLTSDAVGLASWKASSVALWSQSGSDIYRTLGSMGLGGVPTETLDAGLGSAAFGGRKYVQSEGTASGAGPGNGFDVVLNGEHGTTLNTAWNYVIRCVTQAPATDNGATFLVWYDKTAAVWVSQAIARSGTTSTHPQLVISGSNAVVYFWHDTGKVIGYTVEATYKSVSDGNAYNMGSDYHWQRTGGRLHYPDGNVGIGPINPTSKLHVEVDNTGTGINGSVVRVDQLGTGDVALRLSVAAQVWHLGIDNSDNDKLKIGRSSWHSSPDVTIDTSGSVGIGSDAANPIHQLEVGGGIGYRRTVGSKSANYTVISQDSGTVFTNQGAAGAVNLTLPTAVSGLTYQFIVQTGQELKITAAAGDTIRIAGSVTAAGGFWKNSNVGSVLKLVAINGAEWVADVFIGTWVLI